MGDVIIKTEHLGKMYRIGDTIRHDTLRDAIVDFFKRHPEKEIKDSTVCALKDVSFEVKQGEVLGIIGRNGAGKTTLLKIFSRITEPTEGIVKMKGRVSTLLEIGTGFSGELSGRDNIYLNGSILGMKKAEIDKKFDEIVGFAEIERFIDTPVKRYSSGMYVRLAFAVAAHLEPDILLVDEVLAVGDVGFQKKCIGKMGEVAEKGRTVLFVSHNMEAVQKLCTRAMILHEGRVVIDGPTEEVISKYLGEGMERIGERVWSDINNAPGDDVVRVHAVRVLDRGGNVCTNFTVRDPVSVEIEYWVLEKGHRLVVQFYFVNEFGHVLFISKDNLDSPWADTTSPTGFYRAVCHIPGDFLNKGEISIVYGIDTLSLRGGSMIMHATGKDVVNFVISDSMDPKGVRGNYPFEWRYDGVRPRLRWTVEKTEDKKGIGLSGIKTQ